MDETRQIYQEIKEDLVEASNINATMATIGSNDSQLTQDIGQRILETSKKIPSIMGKEGKDDTEYVREGKHVILVRSSDMPRWFTKTISESEGFMNAAAVISENLFQPKNGVIDSKSSVLTDMMMTLIGKTNGDTMEKNDFIRLFQNFSEFGNFIL